MKVAAKGKGKVEEVVKEEEVKKVAVWVEVGLRWKGDEEVSSPKGKVKGKKEEGGGGRFELMVPVCGAGWVGVEKGEERKRMEEMLGKGVEVSVAMNGQQFVPTGLTIKYDRQGQGKKAPAAKKK